MVRTRVGYTGGQKANPTYYSLGDHTETLQIDYDPNLISYGNLLDVFWDNHNPTRGAWSRQYMAAVFVETARQRELAEQSKAQLAARLNRQIVTEIIPAATFYWAEDYHQKYLLRQTPTLMREFQAIYPHLEDFVNSTAAARVNGYLGGYGTRETFQAELPTLGLTPAGESHLQKVARRLSR